MTVIWSSSRVHVHAWLPSKGGPLGRLLLSFPSTVLIQDAAAGLHGKNLRQKQFDKYPLVNKRRNEHSHLEMYKWETLGSVIQSACVKLTFNLSHDPCVKMLSWKLQRSNGNSAKPWALGASCKCFCWEKPGTLRPEHMRPYFAAAKRCASRLCSVPCAFAHCEKN